MDDVRDHHIRVIGELGGVIALRPGLQGVVQLLRDPVAQFGDERLDVHSGDERAQQPGEPAELGEIREQRLTRARVLHLDGHLPAVVPDGPVHLADRGRGRRFVLELLEEITPVGPEPFLQCGVHALGRHRRRGFLQPGEGGAVGAGDLLREGGLEDGEGLPDLHGPALELAQGREELLRRPLLQLTGDHLGRPSADPLAEPEGGASGEAQWQRRQFGGPGDRLAGKIRHALLQLHCASPEGSRPPRRCPDRPVPAVPVVRHHLVSMDARPLHTHRTRRPGAV